MASDTFPDIFNSFQRSLFQVFREGVHLIDKERPFLRGQLDYPQPAVVDVPRSQDFTEEAHSALHIRVADYIVTMIIAADAHGNAVETVFKGVQNILCVDIAAALHP